MHAIRLLPLIIPAALAAADTAGSALLFGGVKHTDDDIEVIDKMPEFGVGVDVGQAGFPLRGALRVLRAEDDATEDVLGFTVRTELATWELHAGPRFVLDTQRVALFGGGGIAVISADLEMRVEGAGPAFDDSDTAAGWYAELGLLVKLGTVRVGVIGMWSSADVELQIAGADIKRDAGGGPHVGAVLGVGW